MRVVSGSCKGRPLKAVPGSSTRPTTDKVKEAVFNMIGPYFSGGLGLDLFAGSGGLGIEALSRGLDKVIFIDREAKAIQTIYENLKSCSFEDKAEVFKIDASRALKALGKRELSFDFIFLDPPYKKQELESLLRQLTEDGRINEGGVIFCEHAKEVELPEMIEKLAKIKSETYGTIGISIYAFNDEGQEGY